MRAASRGWATVVACKVTGPKGEFLGLVSRAITPANFESFFASVTLAPGSSISMHRRDGTLLARYPHAGSMIGRNSGRARRTTEALRAEPHHTTRLDQPGRRRKPADLLARARSNFPIMIVATTTVAAALANWQEQMQFLIGVGAISVGLIAVLLFVVVRRLSRRSCNLAAAPDPGKAAPRQGDQQHDAGPTAVQFISERLVVCNQRYIEMYGLSADIVKPGCSFREVHRAPAGDRVFDGDVDQYIVRRCATSAGKKVTIIETTDGRSMQIVNEPLATAAGSRRRRTSPSVGAPSSRSRISPIMTR